MRSGLKNIVDQVMPLAEAEGRVTATIVWSGKSVEEVKKMLAPIVKKGGVVKYNVRG